VRVVRCQARLVSQARFQICQAGAHFVSTNSSSGSLRLSWQASDSHTGPELWPLPCYTPFGCNPDCVRFTHDARKPTSAALRDRDTRGQGHWVGMLKIPPGGPRSLAIGQAGSIRVAKSAATGGCANSYYEKLP